MPINSRRLRWPDMECSNFYNLFENIISFDEETREAKIAMNLPKTPPAKDYFDHWVFQSINQSSTGFVERVKKDIYFAKPTAGQIRTSECFYS